MLTKHLEKNLYGNFTKMLHAYFNKSWKQHPTKLQLYSHRPLISQTIQVQQTTYVGHCWWSKDKLISDFLLLTPSQGYANFGHPTKTDIYQLSVDTGCRLEDLPSVMNNRDGWQEWVKKLIAVSITWKWWWGWLYIHIHLISWQICWG